MNSHERMIFALQLWWLTFGMDEVHTDKLRDIYAIQSGFIWSEAIKDGILSKATYNVYALTPKALDLIREYEHGH